LSLIDSPPTGEPSHTRYTPIASPAARTCGRSAVSPPLSVITESRSCASTSPVSEKAKESFRKPISLQVTDLAIAREQERCQGTGGASVERLEQEFTGRRV